LSRSRFTLQAAIALAAGFCLVAGAPAARAGSISGRAIVLALSEESLPAAAASPSATASSSPGTPSASASPSPAATAPEAYATPDVPQPGAVATDVPPPADLASVPISAPVSSSSLDPLIQQTTDPSLSASLRITEQARQQIGENHPEEAVRSLGHALSIDASNAYAYFYLGRAYLMKKDYKQALTFFSRAELGMGSNTPWLGETVGFEGACYEEMGRDQDAALAYQRALQLTPGNLMVRAGYGRLASALPPPPVPPEEQPSAENLDQPPPEEEDEVRTVPSGEPLETAPPAEPPLTPGVKDPASN